MFMDSLDVDDEVAAILVQEGFSSIDEVAYVRFASVYRSFEDVNAFREEIERLEKLPTPELKKLQLDLINQKDEEK